MNIEVQKEDIKRIGNTIFCGDDGNLCIISDSDISQIEYILLRNILKCFGDYKIISEEDYVWDSGTDDEEGEIDWDNIDILFVTDMPYSLYQELDKE